MSASGRRAIWFLLVPLFVLVPLLVVAGLGVLALWGVSSFLAGPAPLEYDKPTQLASVSVPHQPSLLAWSADGAYLAGGSWGWGDGLKEPDPSEVYVVDVARGSVVAAPRATGAVQALAFSPDGKWLAVATTANTGRGGAPAELVVLEVPAFRARFRARAGAPGRGFPDLAWAGDGRALYAIDAPPPYAGKAAVRSWEVPAFTERPAIREPQTAQYEALAVSPDGRALAVADQTPLGARMVRLFDAGKGSEQSSFRVEASGVRLGFTPGGEAVGVWDRNGQLSWWGVGTGRPVRPDRARFAIQPPGRRDLGSAQVSPDGRVRAWGESKSPKLVGESWGKPENTYGCFVHVTERAGGKTWTWRVSDAGGNYDAPAVAFSPDGTNLAGTVGDQSGDGTIRIWAVPK